MILLLTTLDSRPRRTGLLHYIVVSMLVGARTEELRALRWEHVHAEPNGTVPSHIEVWRSVRSDGDTKTKKAAAHSRSSRHGASKHSASRKRRHSQASESDFVHDHIPFGQHKIVVVARVVVRIGARHVKDAGTTKRGEPVDRSSRSSRLRSRGCTT
jgi:hypothetical protein